MTNQEKARTNNGNQGKHRNTLKNNGQHKQLEECMKSNENQRFFFNQRPTINNGNHIKTNKINEILRKSQKIKEQQRQTKTTNENQRKTILNNEIIGKQ